MGGMDWHHAAISVEVLRELAARHPDVSVDAAIRLELGLGPRARRTSLLRKYATTTAAETKRIVK